MSAAVTNKVCMAEKSSWTKFTLEFLLQLAPKNFISMTKKRNFIIKRTIAVITLKGFYFEWEFLVNFLSMLDIQMAPQTKVWG